MESPQPRHLRAVLVSSVVGYGLAAALVVAAMIDELRISTVLPGGLALAGFAAVPPTLALLSLRRSSILLLPAGVTGIASVPVLSIVGIGMALLGVVWLLAYGSSSRAFSTTRKLSMGFVLTLWLLAFAALIVHVDPVCERTFSDGSTERFDPSESGFETGWIWDVDTGTFSGGSTSSPNEVSAACSSDHVVWGEAVATLALSLGSVGVAWRLAEPGE